ncbi:MAG: hypothetical protein QOJ42_4704, partial [Acidobacteriaceae bacterium]|nr:hypothetical protein [Acidobacteriaceae bacterium]
MDLSDVAAATIIATENESSRLDNHTKRKGESLARSRPPYRFVEDPVRLPNPSLCQSHVIRDSR